MRKKITLLTVLITLAFTTINAQSTVYLNSNSEWVSEVNSVQETYTHMFDAINRTCERAGEGAEINIKNSGTGFRRNSTAPIELESSFKAKVKAITPLQGQTLDFRNYEFSKNSILTIYNGTDCVKDRVKCGIHIYEQNGVTIKNLIIKGDPRYGIWARNSDSVTISNITMDLSYGSSWSKNTAGIGIRADNQAREQGEGLKKYSTLRIEGDITINGANTHGIETFGMHNVNIGDVLVTNTGGCGVLLNNSTKCEIGIITGYHNSFEEKFNYQLDDNCNVKEEGKDTEGYYATFRVANSNGIRRDGTSNNGEGVNCKGLYSRNSGYGFSSVSGSTNCTIDFIDIKNSSKDCIFIADGGNNNYIKGGTVSTPGLKDTDSKLVNIREDHGGNNTVELSDLNTIVTDTQSKTIIINELEMGFYDIGTGGIIEKDDTRPGYGFCDTADENGRGIIWNVNGAAGEYTFRWKFANGTSVNRSALVYINGRAVSTRNFYGTGSWDKWATTSVTVANVEAGIKNIRLEANQSDGLANIDFIEVTGPGVIPSLIRFDDETISTTTNNAKTINSESLYQENSSEPIQNVNVKIYNLNGQLVKQIDLDLKNEQLDLNNLNKGIYIKKVTTEDNIEVSKIFKN